MAKTAKTLTERVIEEFTKDKSKTNAELAKKFDISPGHVSNILSTNGLTRGIRKAKKSKATTAAPPDDSLEALLFVVNGAAIKAAKDELAKLKDSPTMNFAIESGGIKQAIARLEKIERRLAKG